MSIEIKFGDGIRDPHLIPLDQIPAVAHKIANKIQIPEDFINLEFNISLNPQIFPPSENTNWLGIHGLLSD